MPVSASCRAGVADLDEVRDALADIVSDAETGERHHRARARAGESARRPRRCGSGSRTSWTTSSRSPRASSQPAASRFAPTSPPTSPSCSGDRVQLQQVLLNLVVNGMDAMSTVAEGKRVLEISRATATAGWRAGGRISVKDHGIGLHAEQGERLFEAFYTTKAHGMGMGLAISRSIIEAHGGPLVGATHAAGATFCFSVPAAATISSERPNP